MSPVSSPDPGVSGTLLLLGHADSAKPNRWFAWAAGLFSPADSQKGGIERPWLLYDQAKFQYLQGTLKAFQEVSDALVSEQKLTELEEQQKREVSALNESVAIANKRYRGGLASYYEVLEAQQLLFPAEITLSQTRRDRLLAVVQLYKALGGGWKLTDSQ